MEQEALQFKNSSDAIAYIEKETNEHAEKVVKHWWKLSEKLLSKYSNGYITTGEDGGQQRAPGYGEFWYRNSDFSQWPPVKWVDYPNTPPSTAPAAVIPDPNNPGNWLPSYYSIQEAAALQKQMIVPNSTFLAKSTLTIILIVGVLIGILGTMICHKYYNHYKNRWEYTNISSRN